MKRIGGWPFAWVFAVATTDLDTLQYQMNRFDQLFKQSIDEDRHFLKTIQKSRVQNASVLPTQDIDQQTFMTSNLKLEWLVRDPQGGAHIRLGDCSQVSDPTLLDQALFKKFLHDVGDPFRDDLDIEKLRREYAVFLKSLSPGVVETLTHASTWAWLIDPKRLDEQQAAPTEFVEVWAKIKALPRMSNGLLNVKLWVEARYLLHTKPGAQQWIDSFDRAFVRKAKGAGFVQKILSDLQSVDAEGHYAEQRVALLNRLAEHFSEAKNFLWAARAREAVVALRRSSKTPLQPSLIMNLAQDFMHSGQAKRALELLESNTQSMGQWPSSERALVAHLKARACADLARRTPTAQQKKYYTEWALEHQRGALELGLNTPHRDEWLKIYGEQLEALNQLGPAIETYEALFRGGIDRDKRIAALQKLHQLSAQYLMRVQNVIDREQVFRRMTTSLSFFARAEPHSARLGPMIKTTELWAKKIGLAGDPVVGATLMEAKRISKQ